MPALLINVSTLPNRVVGRIHQSVELVPTANVHLIRHGGAAGLGLDLLCDGHAVVHVAAGDHHVGAAAGYAEGHLATQSATAAGNQHHLIGEVEKLVGITHFRTLASSAAVAMSCGIIDPNASLIFGSTFPVRTPAA